MVLLVDRYELAEPLGSGGMSRVVAAHDRLLGRRVAVKLLRDDLAADPVVAKRLLREARAAASFTHPNAVAVYDVGQDGGQPFIVMELVEGRTLTAVLRERGSLPTDEVLRIADDMLAALAAAHAHGLVHRDVKPGNILLDAEGEARLADFGIAKGIREATAGLTATGQVVGTPRYLAPEQAAGAAPDARSDLYAAGVVCYEMLAGRPPFTGEHAVAVALAHQRDPVPPLVEARPDVPAALAAAVHRALEKDPSARFASAEEMRAALRHADGAGRGTGPVAALGPAAVPSGGPPPTGRSGLDATMTLPADGPAPAGTEAASHGERSWWPAVALVTIAVLGLVALSAALDGEQPIGEPPDGTLGDAAPPAGDGQPVADDPGGAVDAPPTPSPTPEPSAAEQLRGLVAQLDDDLAEDDERHGEKSDDLHEDLEEVLGEDDVRKQAEEARKLMNEIEKWVDEGELDRALGMQALLLLEDFVREQRDSG